LRVRRSSDNAEQDIGFVGNDLDTTTMESFCGAGDGFVVTWYDQSGNTNDATQATAVEQSQIVSSGVTVTEGTRPAATYDGTMSYSLTRFSYSNLSVSSVYKLTSLPANGSTIFSQNLGFIQKAGQATTAYPRFQIYDTGYKTAEFQTTALNAYNHQIGLTDAGTARIFVNGVAGTTQAYGTINNPNNVIKLGDFTSVANTGHIGTIQEIIVWDSNEAANRAGIEQNINNYFSIYTQDNNGFVVTWYDQSGNGNDATQSTAASQPQIVSSGSTITTNSKASITFATDSLSTSIGSFRHGERLCA
jgi:hypothetical protein